jgi:polar amino acid transport system substrate-binding protein
MHRVLLAAALVLLTQAGAGGQTTLRFARIADVPDQMVGGELLKAVYGRLGIAVEFVDVPGARALALSGGGVLDGEIHRIVGIERAHPALIRIDPPLNYIEQSVFTAGLRFDVRGWESLRPYSVGIVRGVGSSEAGTQDLPLVQRAADLESLIRMLEAHRLDLLVTDRFSGQVMLRRMGLQSRIQPLSPPIEHISIHHYLHERHRDLVAPVAAVLREMVASGELGRLREALVRQALD